MGENCRQRGGEKKLLTACPVCEQDHTPHRTNAHSHNRKWINAQDGGALWARMQNLEEENLASIPCPPKFVDEFASVQVWIACPLEVECVARRAVELTANPTGRLRRADSKP